MLRKSTSRRRPLLGVDINSSFVNVIQLSFINSSYCIDAYAQAIMPEGLILGYDLSDIHAVSHCIRQALAKANIKHPYAICAVPTLAAFSKTISIYADLSEQDIEAQVIYEASKYLSYSAEDVSVDFKILGPSLSDVSMLDVWMVATKSDCIRQRVEALRLANLQATVVEVESQAIERASRFLEQQSRGGLNIRLSDTLLRETWCSDVQIFHTALGLALRSVK